MIEVLTAVSVKSAILRDISPYSIAEVHRGGRVGEEIIQEEAQGQCVLPKRQ